MIDKNYCPDCSAFLPREDHKPMCSHQVLTNMKDVDNYGDFTVDLWASGNYTIGKIRNMEDRVAAERSLAIMALGAAGETGEVVEHVKKFLRDGNLDLEALKLELGDMVYYWARLSRFFGFLPSEVLAANVQKLESRRARGKIQGSGDNR